MMKTRIASMLVLFSSMFIAAGARADCRQWDVGGSWHFVQSNGMSPELFLERKGNTLTGKARMPDPMNPPFSVYGSLDGTLDGGRIEIIVYWDSGQVGMYSGRIAGSGLIEGTTFDRTNPQERASWTGDRNAICKFDPADMSNGKPVVALGRVQPATVEAACAQWSLPGEWSFQQGNDSSSYFTFEQQGSTLGGIASFVGPRGDNGYPILKGPVTGRLVGNAIDFTVRWPDGRVGVYTGSISKLGRLQGSTYPQDNPGERVDWTSTGRAECLARVQPPVLGFGRVAPRDPTAPMPSLCDAARSARARNSPAAPGLETRCLKAGGSLGATPVPMPAPTPVVDRAELDRLAAIGHNIATMDYALGTARRSNSDSAYRYGFDIATALFGDPALGAQGKTTLGPAEANIRASLDALGQSGFDDSKNFHFSRHYGP